MQNQCFGCRGRPDKIGILIAQLGTPEAPTAKALKPYLKQFLSDPRVIEANRFVWWFVLNFIILRSRPERSARLYKRIWTEKGSPLLILTESLVKKLRARFQEQDGVEFEFGMRYGNPSLESAIDNLIERGCARILLFPMYPQYSAPTTASTYDVVFKHLLARRFVPTLKVAEPYYRNPLYIDVLSKQINDNLAAMPVKPEVLILSFHGIPLSYVKAGDPYCCMCTETKKALSAKIHFPQDKIIQTYQSRFGKDPWLTPYADETVEGLARKGIKHVAVSAPGFTTDCLETIDELGNEAADAFKQHGGESLTLIPCLNDSDEWAEALSKLIRKELGSWLQDTAQTGKMDCPLDEHELLKIA